MPQGDVGGSADGILRITTFRPPDARASLSAELRRESRPLSSRCRWVGRRVTESPAGPEFAAVSVWDSRAEMDGEVERRGELLSAELRASVGDVTTQLLGLRAYGAWQRGERPCLLRIFRGTLVEGDPAEFRSEAAAAYLRHFEAFDECVAIAAGIALPRSVALVSLWTSWEAVVSATGGDIGVVLPIQMPPWAVEGAAVHYELLAAEQR